MIKVPVHYTIPGNSIFSTSPLLLDIGILIVICEWISNRVMINTIYNYVPFSFLFLCHLVNLLIVNVDLWALILAQDAFLAEDFGAYMIWDRGIISLVTIRSTSIRNIGCVDYEFIITNLRIVTHAPIHKVTTRPF